MGESFLGFSNLLFWSHPGITPDAHNYIRKSGRRQNTRATMDANHLFAKTFFGKVVPRFNHQLKLNTEAHVHVHAHTLAHLGAKFTIPSTTIKKKIYHYH